MLTVREFGDIVNPVGWQLNINRVAFRVTLLLEIESKAVIVKFVVPVVGFALMTP